MIIQDLYVHNDSRGNSKHKTKERNIEGHLQEWLELIPQRYAVWASRIYQQCLLILGHILHIELSEKFYSGIIRCES